jgi:hypothetical protein
MPSTKHHRASRAFMTVRFQRREMFRDSVDSTPTCSHRGGVVALTNVVGGRRHDAGSASRAFTRLHGAHSQSPRTLGAASCHAAARRQCQYASITVYPQADLAHASAGDELAAPSVLFSGV